MLRGWLAVFLSMLIMCGLVAFSALSGCPGYTIGGLSAGKLKRLCMAHFGVF
jgi:hypothetical protein